MSEYTPITGELRDAMAVRKYEFEGEHIVRKELTVPRETFYRLCDAIDSIHANLERENAALKSSAAHAYASGYEYAEMDRDGWIELPKDADGVPIRVGDTVEYVYDTLAPHNVTSINLAGDGWWVYIHGLGYQPDKCRHVTPDTWERIIADAVGCMDYEVERDDDLMDLVTRCKALCERTKGEA